jgi:hypothetical protein
MESAGLSAVRRPHPFWLWLLHAVAWGVLIAFIFTFIASSIYSILKMLS